MVTEKLIFLYFYIYFYSMVVYLEILILNCVQQKKNWHNIEIGLLSVLMKILTINGSEKEKYIIKNAKSTEA